MYLEFYEIIEQKRFVMYVNILWIEKIRSCLSGRFKLEDKWVDILRQRF